MCAVVGVIRNMVNWNPAISSITIHGASFLLNIFSASRDTYTAKNENATTDIR